MCIKHHELKYRGGFDYLFLDLPELNAGPVIQDILLQRGNAFVADEDKFKAEIEGLLDRLHKAGIIRPATEEERMKAKFWAFQKDPNAGE